MSTLATDANYPGTDGVIPIYNKDGIWQFWALKDIFLGKDGYKKFVPKVGDWVVDTAFREIYEVVELNEYFIPTLKKIDFLTNTPEVDLTDPLIGVGPGMQSESFRVYLNKRTRPYTLTVDHRFTTKGTMPSYAMIFRATDISVNGKVISAIYTDNGTLVSQQIPLEAVSNLNDPTLTEWLVRDCSTTEDLPDNERVWVVIYSDTGLVVQKQQMLIENTAFIRTPDQGQKIIESIYLETPWLSTSDPDTVRYPINLPLRGFNLKGCVRYTNGDIAKYPVDGNKFSIDGLQDYVSTIEGMQVKTVLRYNLSREEFAVGVKGSPDRQYKTRPYTFITERADGVYSVKLYCYPVWIDDVNGYRLQWFLSNMDRSDILDVTPYVRINENTAPWNPTQYGSTQRLSVSLDLSKANAQYRAYIHVQVVDIVLYRPGLDEMGTRWTVAFELGQVPPYGRDNFAQLEIVNANLSYLSIGMGEKTVEDWLERLFYLTKPLYDMRSEARSPAPNMFNLVVNGFKTEYRIEQWNSKLTVNTLIKNGDTVYIEWIKRIPSNDIMLGISGVSVFQTA